MWLGLALTLILAVQAAPQPTVIRLQPNSGPTADIVVVAHEDDWQLFMGDVLAKRLRAGNRMVFVYLTAGDDGRDSLYWQTRESAALQSAKVAAGLSPRTIAQCDAVEVKRHAIQRCQLGTIRSYFLRLPDGRRDGRGFSSTGHTSLRKLRTGKTSRLSAIDGSTSYQTWNDLTATVAAITTIDSADSANVVVHTTDPSIVHDPHDHFDHRLAGLLVSELQRGRKWSVRYYVGYALATRAANIPATDVQTKTELFLAYDREMMAANPAWSAYHERPGFYAACMQRTYSRRVFAEE
jgi:LmbE family N-acetylglucosaminyl deacetylase